MVKYILISLLALNYLSISASPTVEYILFFHSFSAPCEENINSDIIDGSVNSLLRSINEHKHTMHLPFNVEYGGSHTHIGECDEPNNLIKGNSVSNLFQKVTEETQYVHIIIGANALMDISPHAGIATRYTKTSTFVNRYIYIPFEFRIDFKTYVHELMHHIQFKNVPQSINNIASYHPNGTKIFSDDSISTCIFNLTDNIPKCHNLMENVDTYFNYLLTQEQVDAFNDKNIIHCSGQHEYPPGVIWSWIPIECCKKGTDYCLDQISTISPKYIDPGTNPILTIQTVVKKHEQEEKNLLTYLRAEAKELYPTNSKMQDKHTRIKVERILKRRQQNANYFLVVDFVRTKEKEDGDYFKKQKKALNNKVTRDSHFLEFKEKNAKIDDSMRKTLLSRSYFDNSFEFIINEDYYNYIF